jgi:hypothetical protein
MGKDGNKFRSTKCIKRKMFTRFDCEEFLQSDDSLFCGYCNDPPTKHENLGTTKPKNANEAVLSVKEQGNLVPRVSPSVIWERPWLRLVTCLPESGR